MNDLMMGEAINQAFVAKLKSGEIDQSISKRIEKFIDTTIEDALSSWGEVGKAFKQKLTTDLLARLDKISLQEYNSLVLQEIQKRIDCAYVESARKHLRDSLDKMFRKPAETTKLSELLEEFKEDYQESAAEEGHEYLSFHVEELSALAFVYLDPEPRKQKHQCKYALLFDIKDGVLTSARKFDQFSGSRAIQPNGGSLHGFDAKLFSLLAWGTKFVLDFGVAESMTAYGWAP